jgi:hypothetical protein
MLAVARLGFIFATVPKPLDALARMTNSSSYGLTEFWRFLLRFMRVDYDRIDVKMSRLVA